PSSRRRNGSIRLIRENGRGRPDTSVSLHEEEQFLQGFHGLAQRAPVMLGDRRFNRLLQLTGFLLIFFMHGTERLSRALQGLDSYPASLRPRGIHGYFGPVGVLVLIFA